LSGFILSGCVPASYTFFRNYTNQPVEIRYSISEFVHSVNVQPVNYHDEMLELKKSTWRKLKGELPVNYSNGVVTFVVPPHCTALLPRPYSHGGAVVLKQGEVTDTILVYRQNHYQSKFQNKSSGFPVVWIHYYDLQKPLTREANP
jgi:hypothetical protein